MNKLIALAVAIAAITTLTGSEASAQTFNRGFQFGAGIRAAGGFNSIGAFNNGFGFFNRGVNRIARPPYFAEFPPVYYSGIVRRPYGISPFAAPAGVTPVELQVSPAKIDPVTLSNPFFNKTAPAASAAAETKPESKSTQNKTTRVTNPFFNATPESVGPTMQASFEVIDSILK